MVGDLFYGDLRRPFTEAGMWGLQRVLPVDGSGGCPVVRVNGQPCAGQAARVAALTVAAGPDVSVASGTSFTLKASATTGAVTSWTWSRIDSSGPVKVAATQNYTGTLGAAGPVTYRVTGTDASGTVATDDVVVTVAGGAATHALADTLSVVSATYSPASGTWQILGTASPASGQSVTARLGSVVIGSATVDGTGAWLVVVPNAQPSQIPAAGQTVTVASSLGGAAQAPATITP
jgi:hypothetical protein